MLVPHSNGICCSSKHGLLLLTLMLQPGLPALVLAARILPGSPALARHPWRHAEETPSPSRVLFNHRLFHIYSFFFLASAILSPIVLLN